MGIWGRGLAGVAGAAGVAGVPGCLRSLCVTWLVMGEPIGYVVFGTVRMSAWSVIHVAALISVFDTYRASLVT